MNKRKLYKIDKLILIATFICVIFTPLIIGIIQQDKLISSVERRKLAPLPTFPKSVTDVNSFPKKFNLYYSDHFGLREIFTKLYFKIINKIGGQPLNNDVTFGDEGWMFLGSIKSGYQKHGDPIGDAININLFSQNELKEFKSSIESISNWLKKRGIEYIYVIAPIKHSIYFEKLPKHIIKQNKNSATDQLISYLNTNSDVNVLDLRKALLDEKRKHQVYFKSDTHWNHYGANRAQFEIMTRIKKMFPNKIFPNLLDKNQFKITTTSGGDLATFSKTENITENKPQPIFNETCTPNKTPSITKLTETHSISCDTKELKAIIFRDSFFLALQPYFSRQFYRTTYIWEKLNYKRLKEYVEKEKPDIVIDEIVERTLPYIPPYDLFVKNQ